MRILIFASGNTFSHLQESLSIATILRHHGHEVHFGVSRYYKNWVTRHGTTASIVPELWERGPTDHPNVSWFIDHDYVTSCVQSEIDLISSFQPDFIFADFKYTTGLSAKVTQVPLLTKNIFSMLPATQANFGYLPEEHCHQSQQQKHYLQFFDHFSRTALTHASHHYGVEPYPKTAHYLDGDMVLVPDSQWFHGIDTIPTHYLPVNILNQSRCTPEKNAVMTWTSKNYQFSKLPGYGLNGPQVSYETTGIKTKNIFIALGSVCRTQGPLIHIVSALSGNGYRLYVSTSGNQQLCNQLQKSVPEAETAIFWNFKELISHGLDLYVCHGGLGSIYNGIEHGVPLLVIPMQPEQDHNGRLVEKHGLGSRLESSRTYKGGEDRYTQTILETPKKAIERSVSNLLCDKDIQTKSALAQTIINAEMKNLPSASTVVRNLLEPGTLHSMASNNTLHH